MIRKPIVAVVGHVDHGKTTCLDTIRESTMADREAGAITQAIGASIVPIETIKRLCVNYKQLVDKVTVPGLLFIDTPGHEAFTNLRRRGGNLADIAILIVDINEGFKPQTIEAIEILKSYKTPFVVAANKIDLVSGWKSTVGTLSEKLEHQSENTKYLLETKMYELVGKFSELGFESERYDRVTNPATQLSIVPICAKSGEGIPELLMILIQLTQKYLEQNLNVNVDGPAKGTILEVKEEQGLGTTLDVIIYDGSIKTNDYIVIGNMGEPIVSKVRVLVEPKPLSELRDKKSKFSPVKEAHAATGIKIAAPDIDDVVAGMPLRVATEETLEEIKEEIQEEIDEVVIETQKEGIIIKADTLGSLEAMVTLLKQKEIPIRKATIGDISKKDIMDAQSSEKDALSRVILGFNIDIRSDASDMIKGSGVQVMTNPVIYRLIEDFLMWREKALKSMEDRQMEGIKRPVKFQIMPNMIFRQSNPAICGTDVLVGLLKTGLLVMDKEGKQIGLIKGIQHEKKSVPDAKAGMQVAVSYDKLTIGRQAQEGDILYGVLTENEFRALKDAKQHLSESEIDLLKEIATIMRKNNPIWGV